MTTIAIAVPVTLTDEQKRQARSIADGFGYGLSFDLAGAEDDVREGVTQAAEKLRWEDFMFLHARTPSEVGLSEYDAALASRIDEELLQCEMDGMDPPFFDFLGKLDAVLTEVVGSYWVVFAGEWYSNERVRLEDGDFSQLISRLRQPANWKQRLWVVAVGETQDSDELPLVFHVHR